MLLMATLLSPSFLTGSLSSNVLYKEISIIAALVRALGGYAERVERAEDWLGRWGTLLCNAVGAERDGWGNG